MENVLGFLCVPKAVFISNGISQTKELSRQIPSHFISVYYICSSFCTISLLQIFLTDLDKVGLLNSQFLKLFFHDPIIHLQYGYIDYYIRLLYLF